MGRAAGWRMRKSGISFECMGWHTGYRRAFSTSMLKITLLDRAQEMRFRLEGRLSGAWVGELGQSWRTASSTIRDRQAVVDLGEVDFVDSEGEALLTEMRRAGVRLHAATPLMRALVEEIEQAARTGAPVSSVSGNSA
jgi:hypothetical protein